MNRKEKLGIAKAGASAYFVCSTIGWVKEGGIQFINRADDWTIRIHKTLGLVEVFRFEGQLQHMDVFGGDALLFWFGMGTSVAAAVVMKLIYITHAADEKGAKAERTGKGYKVKFNATKSLVD